MEAHIPASNETARGYVDRQGGPLNLAPECACGARPYDAIHAGDDLFNTRPYLNRVTGALNDLDDTGGPVPATPLDMPALSGWLTSPEDK